MCLYDRTNATAGTECSSTYEGRHLTLTESLLTHPSHSDGFVDSGDPVVCGNIVGVAFNGAAAADTEIALDTEGIWFLTVNGLNDEGSSAVARGDKIFINTTTCVLSKISDWATQKAFGYALGTVTSGSSGVIAVKVHWGLDDAFERVGSSAVPMAMNTANLTEWLKYLSTTAVSGTTYGDYTRLDVNGAGVEGIAGRSKALLKIAGVGNAHGRHDTLEMDTSAGAVTGLGTGHRGNVVVPNRAIASGTYYGAMAEIYPLGASAALPAGSNACLGINAQPGTAMDLVVNAMSIGGTDGSGKMIYSHGAGNTSSGSIRVLINGVIKFLRFFDAE